MITNEIKQQIVAALRDNLKNYPSAAKMARALDINGAQLSRILRGDMDNVVSDAKWLSLARRLDVNIGHKAPIVAAETDVYKFISAQLELCQSSSLSALLCDIAGIGKTFAARQYVRTHKYAVYIDCSQVKSKQKLIRQIAKEFGVNHTGKYSDVYQDLVFYLRSIAKPLIILDEAGDLDYPAFLELKALWNATEFQCGWYMMGADGLKAKFERSLNSKKIGYAELFRRFGERYQRITPEGREEREDFLRRQIAIVAKANGLTNYQELYIKTQGSLTRLYIEIQKIRNTKQTA